ncbi:MAG: GNAT family N-acetyltransferase, partial [Candidatus Limnocylindria bacterium]
ERDGYAIERYGFEMIRRRLDQVEPMAAPDAVTIRSGTRDEVDAIVAAEDEAFRDHPGHRDWTDEDTRGMIAQPHFDPTVWLVAWDGDQVAGAVENWIYSNENEQLGIQRAWLDRVSVRRPWRQRGLARALIAASLRALHERGITEAMLGVDARNPSGALRLYESLGFERLRTGLLYARQAPR